MKRIIYRVVHASAEENQNDNYHFSKNYSTDKEARAFAQTIKDDFVAVEKVHEFYEHHDWHTDHDAGGVELVTYVS